jgi:DNA-binding response OmpR family regulator
MTRVCQPWSPSIRATGYRITACATAGEGLGLIQKDSFDALIIDVMLPDIDGFEVCRRVRRNADIRS